MSNPLLIFSAVAATALIFSGAQYFYNRKREKEQALRQKIQALMEAHRQRQLPREAPSNRCPIWKNL